MTLKSDARLHPQSLPQYQQPSVHNTVPITTFYLVAWNLDAKTVTAVIPRLLKSQCICSINL